MLSLVYKSGREILRYNYSVTVMQQDGAKSTAYTSARETDHKGQKKFRNCCFQRSPIKLRGDMMTVLCALKNLFKSPFCFLVNQWVRIVCQMYVSHFSFFLYSMKSRHCIQNFQMFSLFIVVQYSKSRVRFALVIDFNVFQAFEFI